MTKAKYLIAFFLSAFLLFLIPNIANATVEYTRTIPGNDGSITINLTGLNLDETKAYSFALTKKGEEPSTWHKITEYTSDTAKVNLNSATSDIKEVLKITDTGILYVRNDADNSYVVDALQINLKLPYLQAIPYADESDKYRTDSLYGIIGDYPSLMSPYKNTYMQSQKVTDKNFIEHYLDIKNNNKNIINLEDYLPAVPSTGYEHTDTFYKRDGSDGLYIIWVKLTGNDCKEVYGAIIHDGLPQATKLTEYGITEEKENETTEDEKISQNEENSDTDTSKNNSINNNNDNKNNDNEKEEDNTTATGTILQTGIGIGLICFIAVVTITGVVVYTKYNKLKDIK